MNRLTLALALAVLAPPLQAQYPSPWQGQGATSVQAVTAQALQPIGVAAVGPVGLTVSDMERSVRFYTEVLAFEKMSDAEVSGAGFGRLVGLPGARARVVGLRLGDEMLELTEYLAPPGRAAPPDWRSNDRWFQHVAIIVRDMDSAFARLEAFGVRHASANGPQRLPDWNRNAGGIRAFYFRDPDDHPLEILWFPPGKGRAKWHAPTDRLFLGIDHTAVVVSDTERSLGFYRDVLGLAVAGASENYGPEQENLNNVPGAHLRITALRAGDGPGIEFLEYVHPKTGRAFPRDERASDLVHWQTRLLVADAGAAAARLKAAGAIFVSAGAVPLDGAAAAGAFGVQARDPDG
ncbi:MAG TPA: VOC family protein, partial [Gemmatimonadales bacterium]|nr:VOC family protein [Gemmatimonadales bacterium]